MEIVLWGEKLFDDSGFLVKKSASTALEFGSWIKRVYG
jgi:hypothetical protein